MMSLYDGLDVDSNQDKVTGWSPSFQMLKSQLQVRKASLTKAKNEKTRIATVTPVIDFHKLRHDNSSSPLVGFGDSASASVFLGGEVLEKFLDEYDPLRPNDYERMTSKDRESRERKKDINREKEIEERRRRRASRHAEKQLQEESSERRFGDYDPEVDKKRAMAGKVAIAPPTALVEADQQSFPMGMAPTSDRPDSPTPSSGAGVQFASNLAGSVAHKIMAKYGFKEGRGLGKNNRGITTALQVEKTSKRGGKIISGDQVEPQVDQEQQQQEQTSVAEMLRSPTRVICLRNMVGPGQVDADLQAETSDECSKYGPVCSCLIYEMPNVPDDEAVRIFIEFERAETAIKALVDLNNRFFGGRTVKASFYDPELYKQFQLSEPL